MHGWLNIASLLLGFTAWGLPLFLCLRFDRPRVRRRFGWFLGGSGLACGLALLCQLLYTKHLITIRDWSALLDTTEAVCTAAAVLVVGTALLSAGAISAYRAGAETGES